LPRPTLRSPTLPRPTLQLPVPQPNVVTPNVSLLLPAPHPCRSCSYSPRERK
jgi:hypothetical protein